MLAKRRETKQHLKEGFLEEGGMAINNSLVESVVEMQ